MKKLKKFYRKLVTIGLSMMLVASMSFFTELNVEAASNPYPSTQDVDRDGYYEIPCTYFAWQQVYDNLGVALPSWGNAVNWWNGARNAGYQTGSVPLAGSIAVWSGDYYGHVAYVTGGSSNTFTVNEGGRTDLDHTSSHGVKYGYTLTNAVGGKRPYDTGKTLLGFIYVNASSSNISYSNVRTNWTDTWNAEIAGDIQNPGRATVAQVGAYVWDSTGTCVVDHRENCGLNYSTINQTLNIVSEARPSGLQSGETYTYQLWANANNQYYFSGKASFTIQDNTKPVISNVKISNLTSEGYTVTCTATDNYKIDRVQFPTWTAANEQDDIVKDWWSNAKCRGIQTGNTFSFTVRRSDHNGEYGVYRTHIYAYDKAGNYSCAPLNYINVEEKKVSDSVKPGTAGTGSVTADTGKVSSSIVQKNHTTRSQNNKAPAVKVKRRTRNSVTLQWKKMKNVTGYRVYRSTKKNSGYKLIKKLNKNTVKYTNKKLKRKKTYYYKVVPMIKSGGKVYKGKAAIIRVKTLK